MTIETKVVFFCIFLFGSSIALFAYRESHNVFVMGCKDYIFNTCGKKVYSNDPNKICEQPDWCCEECANEIIRIKNL